MNYCYNDFYGRRGGGRKPYDYPDYPGGRKRYQPFPPFDFSDYW
jgi:hypothetical protein